jgi:hypothetical protein
MTKRGTIVELLRRFNEAREAFGEAGGPGDGSHVPQMARVWNSSFRELEKRLIQMRSERPSQFWHVSERYIRATRRQVDLKYQAGLYLLETDGRWARLPAHCEVVVGFVTAGERGKTVKGVLGPGPCVVASWDSRVRQSKVDRGVDWLAEAFSGTPYLPVEFLEAA